MEVLSSCHIYCAVAMHSAVPALPYLIFLIPGVVGEGDRGKICIGRLEAEVSTPARVSGLEAPKGYSVTESTDFPSRTSSS